MIYAKKILIVVLFVPILILIGLVVYKKHILTDGQIVVLPISGYDPRDILAGHYLIYQVNYPVADICAAHNGDVADGYVCLQPSNFSYQPIAQCKLIIKGVCRGKRFVAGIEKFYIPEAQAAYLNQSIIGKNASIEVSVMPSGRALVKTLLINGKPWRPK